MDKVESGKLLDFFNSLLKTIDNVFESLSKFESKVVNKDKDGSVVWEIIPSGDDESGDDPSRVVRCKVKPDESKKRADLLFMTMDNKNKKKYEDVKLDDKEIEKYVKKYLREVFGDESWAEMNKLEEDADSAGEESDASSAHKFSAKLKKVVASDGSTVELISITANYSPVDVLSDIDALVSDDDFVVSLPDNEEVCYEVTCTPDEALEAQPVELLDIDMADSLNKLLDLGYHVFFLAMNERFNRHGLEFIEYRSICSTLEWTVSDQLNSIHGMYSENNLQAPFVLQVVQPDHTHILTDALYEYIAAMELYYCNVPHQIQAVLDKWIRELEVVISQIQHSC